MRFFYTRYTVQGTTPNSYALSSRPMINVRVIGPAGDDDIFGRVDSGADDTLLPDYLIATLGVNGLSLPIPIGGIGDAAVDDTAPDTKTYSVEFLRSGRSFTCAEHEYVLDAAYAAGLNPASSCGQGMCGTCKTTLLSGNVDMQHNGGIRPREIAQNKVLICCSKPLSDLTIDA